MNRLKKPRILVSLGMFSLAFGNIGGWIIRRHAGGPIWADSGDFIIGLGVGLSFALSLAAFRMKNRAAC